MKALNTPPAERKWLGDPDYGWCPNCHSNALCLGEPQWKGLQYPIECVVCGAGRHPGADRGRALEICHRRERAGA